jgi:endopeptidase E
VTSWLRFWVLTSCCLLVLMGARGCDPEPVTPPGGTGGALPSVGGSGGWEDPFTGGSATVCPFVEVPAVRRLVRSAPVPRVINGEEAAPGTMLWMASYQYASGSHRCSGSLVAPGWVLTAGHCLPPHVGDRVVVGRQDLRGDDGQVRGVKRALRHKLYVDWSEGHDVALLELDAPVLNIAPVRLASPLTPPVADQLALLAGWGRTCSTCPTSPKLLVSPMDPERALSVLDYASCRMAYPGDITDDMLCTEGPGVDAAPGDSGGFLGQFLGPDGLLMQVADVSWGRPCRAADPGENPVQTCVGVYASLMEKYEGIHNCIGPP